MDEHIRVGLICSLTVILMLLIFLPTASGHICHTELESCEMGHEMRYCETVDNEPGRYCRVCGEHTFQPHTNYYGDRCRLRRSCRKFRMFYKDVGSTTRDAECECEDGYHFLNEDQRACVLS